MQRSIDQGWHAGPRIVPAGHAVTPYGGHLDPTVFQRMAPGIMPLSVAEGIANGVSDVRACVRYQIRHGAKVIKVSASGGVMSHSTAPGAQQYSDEEFVAIADEAHRAGVRVAAHAIGDSAIRACIRAGIDCIEHGFLATDETIQMMVDHGTFLVSTTYLTEAMAVDRIAPELRKKANEVFPRAKAMLPKAIAAGVRIACGTDAPAIPHGRNAEELCALVRRGMTPMQAIRAATVTSAELIEADHELGPPRARLSRRRHCGAGRSLPRHLDHARRPIRHERRPDPPDNVREQSMELTDNILWLLKQAFHFSLTSLTRPSARHGVTTAQIGLMRQLANEPGLSGAELARRLLITPQGAQLALAALERRGLVERKQDPQHGRIMQAYLTDEGRADTSAVLDRRAGRARKGFRRADERRAAAAARPAGSCRRKGHRPHRVH